MFFSKNFMIEKTFNKLKTINNVIERRSDYDMKPQRDKVNICVIDDEGFPLSDNLKKLGYTHIDIKYNFVDISEYSNYEIILCDLDGVGKVIDSKKQGLAIVEQIKINYPSKKIFVYSGKSLEGYGQLPEEVLYIPKHSNPNEISQILDSNCSYLWDPIEAWNYIYERLIDAKVSSKVIAVIEDRFAESIIEKDNLFVKRKIKFKEVKDIAELIGFIIKIVSIIVNGVV